MKKMSMVVLGVLFLWGQAAFADDCGALSILVINTTQSTCKLTNHNLMHGYIVNSSHIPTYIPAGTTAPALDLVQGIAGPEIEMTYQCGDDKTISLYTKQNYCFLSAGSITGRILNKQNMDAEYTAREGSGFWGQHGTLSWVLTG
jgi:hypothetical protein